MEVPEDPLWEARLVEPPPRLDPPRLIVPRRIDPTAALGPTRAQARSKRFRSCGPGWVVPVDAGPPEQPAQRIIEAATALPRGGAVTAWGSIHLAGARYFDGTTTAREWLPVQLLTPTYRADRPGFTFSRTTLHPTEIVMRHGIPCTNIHRALCDAICSMDDLREAVVMIDMVMYAELTSLARFGTYLASVPKRRGLTLARQALALANEGSQSPRETLMRLIWILDALLAPPLCNRPLHSPNGLWLAQPDLLDPVTGVVGEYDGRHHEAGPRRRNDINREVRLRNHGLEYFSFIKGELHDRQAAVRRMHAAVARANASRLPRQWTLDLPHGGTAWSLDERRELRAMNLSPRQRLAAELDTPEAAPGRSQAQG